MSKALILGLMVLCWAYGPKGVPWTHLASDPASRQAACEELIQEVRRDGLKLNGGPWDLTNPKSLSQMRRYGAFWSRAKHYLGHDCIFATGRFDNDSIFDQDGEVVQSAYDISNPFVFETPADALDLAEKLCNGEALSEAYLVFFRLSCEDFFQIRGEASGKECTYSAVSLLRLDRRGFFFSCKQKQDIPAGSVLGSYWTMDSDLHAEAAKRNAMKCDAILVLQERLEALEQQQDQKKYKELLIDMSKVRRGILNLEGVVSEEIQQNRFQSRQLQKRLEALEQEKEEASRREQVAREEREDMLKKMEEMSKLITEGPCVMMQSFVRHNFFIQQNFARQVLELLSSHSGSARGESSQASEMGSSSTGSQESGPSELSFLEFNSETNKFETTGRRARASHPEETASREVIMKKIIEENSQLMQQSFDQQMRKMRANLDELNSRLRYIFAPNSIPRVAEAVVHESASDWSRRLEDMATPVPSASHATEPHSPPQPLCASLKPPLNG